MSPVPLSLLGQCSVLMCLMYSILLCLSIKRRKSEFSVFGQKENNLNNSKIAGEKKKNISAFTHLLGTSSVISYT